MKKSKIKTRTLAIGVAMLLSAATGGALAQVPAESIKSNAPGEYTVTQGDSLWSISAKFLNSASQWPLLWKMNPIHNPALIYPGDVLVLNRSGNSASLTIRRGSAPSVIQKKSEGNSESNGIVRMSPRIYTEESSLAAIPAIPYEAIGPFLKSGLVINAGELLTAPGIVATEDGRINLGAGGKAYANIDPSLTAHDAVFDIFHPGVAIIDFETQETLGYEATRLGSSHVIKPAKNGSPATIRIDSSVREIGLGDRLTPASASVSTNFIPHAAPESIRGRIVQLNNGMGVSRKRSMAGFDKHYEEESGPLSVVILNRGSKDGLESGHVFKLSKAAKVIKKRSTFGWSAGEYTGSAETVLPVEAYGEVMVFRVFERVSYAIVMKTDGPVNLGDEFGAE